MKVHHTILHNIFINTSCLTIQHSRYSTYCCTAFVVALVILSVNTSMLQQIVQYRTTHSCTCYGYPLCFVCHSRYKQYCAYCTALVVTRDAVGKYIILYYRTGPRTSSFVPGTVHSTREDFFSVRVCVCMYICVFIKLHISTQSCPVILVILCHSHWSSQGGINDTRYENLWSGATEGTHSLYLYNSYLGPEYIVLPPCFLVAL